MADSTLGVLEAAAPSKYVDNESVTTGLGTVQRQRVRLGGSTGSRLAEVFASGALMIGHDAELLAPQNITASSGVGASTANGIADAVYPAGSVLVFQASEDHSNVDIQISGTWTGTLVSERTIDGVTWYPTNTRRNAAGNQIQNQLTQNGLYVGTYATTMKYRIRALPGFTGTASISFAGGVAGGVFLLSEVTVVTEAQYFASIAGKNSAWGVCSQEINFANASTEQPLMWLWNNEAASGRVLYLSKTVLGSSGASKFRRYRTGPGGTNMTRTSGGTALTINNRANQAASATAAQAWAGTSLVIANQPSYYEKTTWMPSGGGQLETDEGGSILIPPQTGMLWTVTPTTNNQVGIVEVVYWDGLTLP